MELKEFVKNSLLAIAEGVHEATDNLPKGGNTFRIGGYGQVKDEKYINFDVAVTTTTEKTAKAEGRAKIYVIGGGVEGAVTKSTENVSRIQFRVYYGS